MVDVTDTGKAIQAAMWLARALPTKIRDVVPAPLLVGVFAAMQAHDEATDLLKPIPYPSCAEADLALNDQRSARLHWHEHEDRWEGCVMLMGGAQQTLYRAVAVVYKPVVELVTAKE
jgi:hypothetical protein